VQAHPLSAIGIALTTVSALLFLSLWALDAAGWIRNPYVGLLAFIAIPACFAVGLILIPIGGWLGRRRARRGLEALPRWPAIDLNEPRVRRFALLIVIATVINIVLIAAAGHGAVEYMDSPAFCGGICHTPMQPQFVQWQQAPHAQIACVDCHVGSEPGGFLKAKTAGTRRLFHMITGAYPRPILAGPSALPAPAFTCEACHSRSSFTGDKLVTIRSFGDDEANTESVTTLHLHVGVGPSPSKDEGRIHWHADPNRRIEFVADGPDGAVSWVRVTEHDGQASTYVADGVKVDAPNLAPRRMDCLDCHSRPAHPFAASAERVVDRAIAEGRLDRSLPSIRQETVRALTATHATTAEGVEAIGRALRARYGESTVQTAQALYQQYVFPSMHVGWGTYANQLGHADTAGCFRCHDDSHKTTDGRVIRQDCTLCHAIEQ